MEKKGRFAWLWATPTITSSNSFEAFNVLAKAVGDATVAVHHQGARGAARERLEAERAAAGEQVEAFEPVEPLAEPVEERFTNAIRSRAQLRRGWEPEQTAAPFA